MKRWFNIGFIATVIIVIAIPFYMVMKYIRDSDNAAYSNEPTFVGKEQCFDCHKAAYDLWTGSHHDKAMAVATDSSVLGDFNNSEFESFGFTSRFYKKDRKFYVYTKGPGGDPGEFEITHTFGYTPLQQYLIPFENGRYQCLPITWDTEKKEWFHMVEAVYGEEIAPNDWLYWTNNGQNWNGMCAECHSTNLKKNYDPVKKTFNTTYSEINVSCEACHGPSSKHVEWANLPEMARSTDTNFDLIVQTSNLNNKQYVDLCAFCHSRRTSLGDFTHGNGSVMDNMIPTLLDHNYFPDGQILEEDYVYGSFTQSKMYNTEIMCNDCHNVHSGKLAFDGNELCAQCHLPETYDSYNHHFHKYEDEKGEPIVLKDKTIKVGEGALCINCHMPARYYMGNDLRNDHSLRVPRPDLTMSIGTPNACNGCHQDKSAKWSDDSITKWYGIKRKPHYGTVIAAARERKPGTDADLLRIAADDLYLPIVRATSISYLENYRSEEINKSLKLLLQDPEPLIRYTASRIFVTSDLNDHLQTMIPLLNDPVKAVRTQAALRLTEIPADQFPQNKKALLNNVLLEYKSAMEYAADFAGGRQNLGIMYANTGQLNEAVSQYKEAIDIDSLFFPAKVNLAMVLNQQGKNDEAELVFKDIIKKNPEFIDAYYSLGLLLAEDKKYDEAIVYLKEAAVLMPERSRVFYNLGLILQFQEKYSEAERELKQALKLEPQNRDFMYALADHYIKTGNYTNAKIYAGQLKAAFPGESIGQEILYYIAQLESQSN